MRPAFPSLMLALALVTFVQASAAAQTAEVVALLTGGEVVPNKVLTGAFGLAELTLDSGRGEVTIEVQIVNLPSRLTAAHIHVGAPGLTGPVLFDLRPMASQSGDVSFRGTLAVADLTARPELGIRTTGDALESVAGLATYLDIHTEGNGNGELRGQLLPVDVYTATALRRLLERSGRTR